MDFKVGDEVKMVDERLARLYDVWQAVGVVTALVKDETALKRISVKFPNTDLIEGWISGQYEIV